MEIEIDVDDADALKMLNGLSGLPMDKVMRDVSDVAEQLTRDRFRTETTPRGDMWKPHKPETIKARERKGSASRALLIDTGSLYASMKREHGFDFASVSVGGPGMFATVHQEGLPPIPARPFVPEAENLPTAYLDALFVPIQAAIDKATR